MNTMMNQWMRRARTMGAVAAMAFGVMAPAVQAAPNYDQIGQIFARLIQGSHVSHALFTQDMYKKFFDNYIQMQDPQHLFLTQQDVDALYEQYGSTFGDYLVTGETTKLAEAMYGVFQEKALNRIAQAEKMITEMNGKLPAFDSDRNIPRTRRKLPRAKDDAELDQVWRDQVEDMLLSEVSRRENMAKLAAAKGKPDPNANEMPVQEKMLSRLKRMRSDFVEADREDMVSFLLNAVARVYDPHSDYMGAREEQRFKHLLQPSTVGIGARLKADDDGSTTIEGIVKGGPAAKSGQLKLGDHIVAVSEDGENWTDIMFLSIDKVVDRIRGKAGQPISMRVQDADTGEAHVVTITRDVVPMSEEMASGKIVEMKAKDTAGNPATYKLGILTLPSFYMDLDANEVHCAADVKRILSRMIDEGVQGLVVDLRFNGGGSLEEVRKMVGLFTGAGPVVQVKDSRDQVEKITVSGKPLFNGQVVVLINKLSASASEIFAGAMADYGRALIVGDPTTFGKGTVQLPRDLAAFMPYFSRQEGCGLIKVTTQKFYRVGGASTQLKGVASDIVIPSVTQGFRIGEGEQDFALPYDEIPSAGGYVKSDRIARILPDILKKSQARMKQDKDLQYYQEDADRADKRYEENSISLNKQKRQDENNTLLERKKAIDAERKVRYEKMAKQDEKDLVIHRLNLEDVEAEQLPLATKEDKDKFMDMADDPEDELVETPDFPSDIDPVLRESMNVVKDMIDIP
ncbi:MAG: carboxy terminal-processing peptidase [Akkermansia sp.]|nr:carboxy terminal-processing peptidase [Akkermansia sp.]